MQKILEFLKALEENNSREWYHANKAYYKEAYNQFALFVNMVITELGRIDPAIAGQSADKSIFRLFRDTRFNRNRPPLKTNFGAAIAEGGRKSPYPSYYIHIEPGNSFIGGGVYCPQSDILKAIRTYLLDHADRLQQVLSDEDFKQYFKTISGEKLKTQPRGFPREHPNIDFTRYKSYIVGHFVTDQEVLGPGFFQHTLNAFSQLKRFNDVLREAYPV